jgi:multicomponent Na+:H+ antiporter subunit G
MDLLQDVFSWAFIVIGGFFLVVGGLGLVRLPDFYTRLHAAGITDTMGAGLLLLGMMVHEGWTLVTVKLFLIGLFLYFTSPTATHAVANAAFVAGLKPWLGDGDEEEVPPSKP